MSGHAWTVKNKLQAEDFCKWIMEQQASGKEYTYSIKEMTRSISQNAALHATFRRLSTALNDAGYDMKSEQLTKKEIPWTEVSIKEVLFKPIIKHMFDADSTSKLTKEELGHAVEVLLREVGSRTGVSVSFNGEDMEGF